MTERAGPTPAAGAGAAPKAFSTRFLPSVGIPAYNALLDSHLGKRREYLLGNRKALELLQQTGVVARVQASEDNPNQYFVYMSEKPIRRRKRLPPPPRMAASASAALLEAPASEASAQRGALHRATGLRKSETTPHLESSSSSSNRKFVAPTEGERSDDEEEERGDISTPLTAPRQPRSVLAASSAAAMNSSTAGVLNPVTDKLSMMKRLGRSLSTNALSHRSSALAATGAGGAFGAKNESLASTSPGNAAKSVVEAQLPLSQRVALRSAGGSEENAQRSTHAHKKPPLKGAVEHLLECDATYMAQIRGMRDQLADLEQDKARLDAEVAQIRRHVRGVNAVHENDVAVAHCSAIMQHRLSKAEEEYMKLLTAQQQVRKDVDRVRREITSLKKVRRKLEVDIEDVRRLNAGAQDKIWALKSTRNVVSSELVELEKKAELAAEEQRLNLPPDEAVIVDVEKLMSAVQERNAIRRSAFQLVQKSLGCSDLTAFVDSFVEVEEQLLSKYMATLALEEETAALQREAQRLAKDAAARHASIRGDHEVSRTLHVEMQAKVRALLARIESYNELREVRNQEHTRVRAIMQRCLEVLQAESLLSDQESIGGPVLMSELPSPAMLEALQKKMTEVAMVMKLRRRAKIIEGPRNCFQAGRDVGARRSNMFATREASQIVMGPREPAGSALAAILGSAQAPSVETALALTERNSLKANHGVVCVADAMTARRTMAVKRGRGSSHARVRGGFEGIDSDVGPSSRSRSTVANTRQQSSRAPVAFSASKASKRVILEDERNDEDDDQSEAASDDQ
ncbi:hypothetical protein PybrP1_010980 [[Pythium] brassicae (nom. inval.)]|nr:hypothetical protein PybrP1_010980 [[Pythium] brassicae (nom. inval.)]